MNRIRAIRWILLAAAGIALGACYSNTPTGAPADVLIAIGPGVVSQVDTMFTNGVVGAIDTSTCPSFAPDTATVQLGQSVQWINNSGASLTLFESSLTVPTGSLIVTIAAGDTSAGTAPSGVSPIQYYSSTCVLTGGSYIGTAGIPTPSYNGAPSIPAPGLIIVTAGT